MAYKNKYHDDSDADDEYERSVVSPALPLDYEESSPTDSGPLSAEHTPTTFTHSRDSKGSPTGLISEWTAEQTRDFISELGLGKYATKFVDEGITGEALVALQPEDLKELNVNSLGHRLTILKAVYEIKVKQNVPMDPDHYIPLSADTSAQEAPPTQEDLAHVIRVLQNRDEEIQMIKSELRHSKDDLSRLLDENRKLREEFLPLVRMLKDSQQPLPTPNEHVTSPPAQQERAGSSLSRKFSTKKLFLGSAPKNPSPTIHEGRTLVDNTNLDPSAAALAASSHLTASMTGGQQMSPNSAPQPSPTSPAYSQNQNRAYNRSDMPRSGHPDHETTPSWPNTNTWASDSTAVSDRNRDMRNNTPAPLSSRPMRNNAAPTPDPNDRDREPPLSGGMNSSSSTLQNPPSSAPAQTPSSNPQVEIFKSFRVSIDDPCHKVLPVALKKYNITADWRQYALYIVHGDQERCLGLNERPLILFKQLDKEGRKPMFMLRKHAAPAEGHVSTVGGGDVRSVGTGGGFGWDGGNRGVQLPGGVL
ncbi:RA-domain-containing protein [Lindgomyces ingoldianus]|uniref:RA-domain-containing protein n=1 Tax=Lindgomyces ingoldianus TaxID=673940 RepID=A0ACB6QRN7_9PLEO|nr:RA-domain-containing protein [Lindgomyces ingoldianus]KAF2468957.1 RA-domain-containing protein [Lindgomyces ingoldianus]